MLIEFSVTNFRSFRDKQTLSMVAAGSDKEHLETHTLDSGIKNFDRLLASAVVYGPNAAGKTNLLRALQFMQSHVTNSAVVGPISQVAYTPFLFDTESRNKPSSFEVTFIANSVRYEYGFSIDNIRVHHEWLIEYRTKNPSRLFDRTYDNKHDKYDWVFSAYLKGNKFVWRDATRPNALFLSTAIQLNNSQLLQVYWWFQKRLIVIAGASMLNAVMTLKMLEDPTNKERILPFVRVADLGVDDVKVSREILTGNTAFLSGSLAPPLVYQDSPTSPPILAHVTFSHVSKGLKEPVALPFEDESNGTQVLFRNAGAWLNVFLNGEVLVIDEIDTSLHTLLVAYFINRFHSSHTNQNNAQLVFSTHNTSLLSQDLFRRDQIWFVEKSENSSKLYPLSDFSPRKDEMLERWYMRGRYGALPILGVSDV
jgi:hypothetical protein